MKVARTMTAVGTWPASTVRASGLHHLLGPVGKARGMDVPPSLGGADRAGPDCAGPDCGGDRG